jgi:hypothetical protein
LKYFLQQDIIDVDFEAPILDDFNVSSEQGMGSSSNNGSQNVVQHAQVTFAGTISVT